MDGPPGGAAATACVCHRSRGLEAERGDDPRLSLEERYGTHEAHVRAITDAASALVGEGRLLQEDADRYVEAAQKRNPLDPNAPLLPLSLSKAAP